MSIVNIVLVLCVLGQFGAKADFRVYFEDLSVEAIDPKYFDIENTEMYIAESSTDENTITTNLSVVSELPADGDAHFKLAGLSMGKYNLPTGVDIMMKLCEILEEPIILGPFFAVLGFSADTCPPTPGIYFQEGYVLPTDNLPDNFPENKYVVVFEIIHKGKPILAANIYIEIQ